MAARSRFENLDDETREEILREAGEEFAEKGYESASLNEIIERAGISKGSLYYYFEDKEDLFATVVDVVAERIMSYATDFSLEELDEENFWDEIGRVLRSVADFASRHRWYVRLGRTLYKMRDRQPGTIRDSELFELSRRWTERIIERGREIGVVREDVPRDYLVEMSMAIGEAGDRWFLERVDELDDEAFEREAGRFLDVFRRILEPRDDDLGGNTSEEGT